MWFACLTALLALGLSGCTIQVAGNDRVAILRGTVTGGGAVVPNATVTATTGTGPVSTTTDTTGTYRLNLKDVPDRIVISATATGHLPSKALVEYRGGVFHYLADIALPAPTRLAPGAETTIALGGRMFKVKAPSGSVPDGGYLEVAALPPEAGPGAMETSEAVDQRLQSLGLFFVRAMDAAGRPGNLQLTGTQAVTFTFATDLPQLTDMQPLKIYTLGDDGLWAPSTTGGAVGVELAANQAGYWNVGRAYKPGCVRGKLSAPLKSCTGERMRVGGLDGIYTQDTTGTGGAFCLEGAQGRSTPFAIGSRTQQITFPSTAGSCRLDPDACTEISAVTVADTDCPISCERRFVDDPASSTGCSTK
jgi:hypothetical protein